MLNSNALFNFTFFGLPIYKDYRLTFRYKILRKKENENYGYAVFLLYQIRIFSIIDNNNV